MSLPLRPPPFDRRAGVTLHDASHSVSIFAGQIDKIQFGTVWYRAEDVLALSFLAMLNAQLAADLQAEAVAS